MPYPHQKFAEHLDRRGAAVVYDGTDACDGVAVCASTTSAIIRVEFSPDDRPTAAWLNYKPAPQGWTLKSLVDALDLPYTDRWYDQQECGGPAQWNVYTVPAYLAELTEGEAGAVAVAFRVEPYRPTGVAV
ncbi:hypothetical protein [Microbispora sp. NPDC049125]|uniref:hypothetical protein n=1 Tax=Microbispora sp. NPDC049125 TaxID=3154929 RepID=UPI0034655C5D